MLDYRKAIAAYPDLVLAHNNVDNNEEFLGHTETALKAAQTAVRLLDHNSTPELTVQGAISLRLANSQAIAFYLGDYTNAVSLDPSGAEFGTGANADLVPRRAALSIALQHDGIGARAYLSEMSPPPNPPANGDRAVMRFQMDAALESWQAVVASEESVEKTLAEDNSGNDLNVWIATRVRPFLALAKSKLGDIAGAEAVIATTPGDCYDCIRMRGNIAAIERNWGRADYWFARAVQQGPSIPMAYANWGQALLERGDLDAAIEKFTLANKKGPHFADPLEMWGEALMAKNQSHLALAKFAEAEKYAPNWGRLHLKWGEALGYAGKKDEAQKQFAAAAGLDLTPTEKIELAKVSHG